MFSNCLEDIFKFFASDKTCLTAKTEHDATKLFKTFTDIPEPNSPIWCIFSPKIFKIGKIFSKSFGLAPTINVRVASFAFIGAPDIGASIILIFGGFLLKNSFKNAGDNVEQITSVLCVLVLNRPS